MYLVNGDGQSSELDRCVNNRFIFHFICLRGKRLNFWQIRRETVMSVMSVVGHVCAHQWNYLFNSFVAVDKVCLCRAQLMKIIIWLTYTSTRVQKNGVYIHRNAAICINLTELKCIRVNANFFSLFFFIFSFLFVFTAFGTEWTHLSMQNNELKKCKAIHNMANPKRDKNNRFSFFFVLTKLYTACSVYRHQYTHAHTCLIINLRTLRITLFL